MSSSEMLLDARRGNVDPSRNHRARRTIQVAQGRGKTIVRYQGEAASDSDTIDGLPEEVLVIHRGPIDRPAAPEAMSAKPTPSAAAPVRVTPAPAETQATFPAPTNASVPMPRVTGTGDLATGLSSDLLGSSGGGSAVLGKHSTLADELRGRTADLPAAVSDELVEVAQARFKGSPVSPVDRIGSLLHNIASPLAWLTIGAAITAVVIASYLVLTMAGPLAAGADDSIPAAFADVDPSDAGHAVLQQARDLERQGNISEAWTTLQTYKMTTPVDAWPQGLLKEVHRLEAKLAQQR